MMTTKKDEEMRTYHVETNKGAQRVTVPAKWKVTFGNVSPGNKNNGPGGELCLRFYEGAASNQRMVIVGVVSFRDMSIKVEEKRVETKQEVFRKQTDMGMKDFVVEGRVAEWVNPDAPTSNKAAAEFFSLSHQPSDENEDKACDVGFSSRSQT